MKKLILIIFFLIIVSPVLAQNSGGPFIDFGSNFANSIFDDVNFFSGTGPLGASDVTVQLSLQTLNNFLSLTNLSNFLCNSGQINCIYDTVGDCPDSDRCLVFEDEVFKLYVKGTLESQWPTQGVFNNILLVDGVSNFLLVDGTSKLRRVE